MRLVSLKSCGCVSMLLWLAAVSAARADVLPPSSNSSVPSSIRLVASDGTQPARAFGEFDVVVRDLANNPMHGVTVTVDLSGHPDLLLGTVQLDAGVQLDCPNHRASRLTDATGTARFTLVGASSGAGGAVTQGAGAQVIADGVLLANIPVSVFDLDGELGLGATDFSIWLGDFVTGIQYARCDFDGTGSLGANDLSVWLTAYGSGLQVVSCAATCP